MSPIILDNVTPEMRVFNEECFAPLLSLVSYRSEDEAIKLANKSDYGLAASIWSRNLNNAEKLSKHITAGTVCINEWIKGIANPSLPFGGIKDSGFGRYHGEDGVKFFSDKISILISKSKNKSEINWLPYENDLYNDFKKAIMFLLGIKKIGVSVLKSLFKLKNRIKR